MSEPHVHYMKSSNYKILADFCVHPNRSQRAVMIVDTGAGISCVRTDALKGDWQSAITKNTKVRIRVANGSRLRIRRILPMWVRLSNQIVKEDFLVCDALPVPAILGTSFIDKNIEDVQVQRQRLLLIDGSVKPIIRAVPAKYRFPVQAKSIFPKSQVVRKVRKKNKVLNAVRVTISPKSQKWI